MATGFLLVDSPNPYTPQGTSPRRGIYGALSGTCILHTSEGGWNAGVGSLTRLVQSRSDYGCYHQACDWQDIVKYYPWEWETWQDSETNNWAVGIAAACRTTDWNIMPADIAEGYYRNMARMAADFVVYMRVMYGIEVPRRRITGAEARARVPGFCAHGDSGVSRSDPGVQFDWNKFFNYTNQALAGNLEDDGEMALSPSFEGNVRASLESLHTKEDTLATKYNKFDSQVREALDLIRNEQAAQRVLLTADRGLSKEELLDAIEKAVIKVNVSVGSVTTDEPNPA